MFISKDSKEFKWYWLDGKMHTVSITLDDEKVDIEELNKTALALTKDKEDLCKSIYYLGLSMTGNSDTAWGFLLGWLVRSIKKDKQWVVNHLEEEVPVEEAKEHIADAFEKCAKMIRSGEMDGTVSTPNIGGNDGTDLFNK